MGQSKTAGAEAKVILGPGSQGLAHLTVKQRDAGETLLSPVKP